jgi:small subunit ribosomal protein S16
MPAVIRLSRQGAKHKPQYQIVAVDKTKRRDGAVLERLGFYFPKEKDPKAKVRANKEAIEKWLKKGAQVSETVGHLLKGL